MGGQPIVKSYEIFHEVLFHSQLHFTRKW